MKSHPVTYVIFDLLHLDGRDLTGEPYSRRRELLEGLGLDGLSWQTPGYVVGRAEELLAASAERRLEGIVLKRLDSRYAPGKRGGAWLKVKNLGRQEFAIGGWQPGEGRRRNQVGSILLGWFDANGELRYAGKVGTGFSDRDLDELRRRLRPLARKGNPFAGRRGPRAARLRRARAGRRDRVSRADRRRDGPPRLLQGPARGQAGDGGHAGASLKRQEVCK